MSDEKNYEAKHDKGKYKPSLIYTSLLEELSKVREHGKKEYGSFTSWQTVEPMRWLDAAIRHIRAVMDGEDFDKKSKLLHLAHAECSLMYAMETFLKINRADRFHMKLFRVDENFNVMETEDEDQID